MRLDLLSTFAISVLAIPFLSCPQKGVQGSDQRPNILLVVTDDMGWTELGSYGSEIDTPNLDALSRQGVKFTDFDSR